LPISHNDIPPKEKKAWCLSIDVINTPKNRKRCQIKKALVAGSTVGNFVCLNHKNPRRQMFLSNCLVVVVSRVEMCGWVGAWFFLMKNMYFLFFRRCDVCFKRVIHLKKKIHYTSYLNTPFRNR
jgi:hypothetical protein